MNAIQEKIEKFRKKYPEMFKHPELRPGEVWIGDFVIDFVGPQVGVLSADGYKSVRAGKTESFREVTGTVFDEKMKPVSTKMKVPCRPIFALATEAVQFLVL